MIEDAELLRRFVEAQAEDAFAELVRRRIGLVYAVALGRTGGNAHYAADATQVVFTSLARKAPTLLKRPVLAGWLCRSAQFAASDIMRAERSRHASEQEARIMDDQNCPENPSDWEKLRPVLDDTLIELSDRDRDALVLRFFDGQPFATIGARLRLSDNAARMRVERALEKMRRALKRRGVTSTAAALGLALAETAGAAAPAGLATAVTHAALAGVVTGGSVLFATAAFTMSTFKTGVVALAVLAGVGVLLFEQRAYDPPRIGIEAVTPSAAATPPPSLESAQSVSLVAPAQPDGVKRTVTQMAKAGLVPARRTEQQMVNLRKKYAPLIQQLGLQNEQAEALFALLLNRLNTGADVTTAAQATGIPLANDSKVFIDTVTRAKTEIDDRVVDLLGTDGYVQYLAFDKDQRSYAALTNVQKLFASGGVPLTSVQASNLQSDLTAKGTLEFGVRQVTEDVIAHAESYLSAPQLAALRRFQSQQKEMVRAKVRLRDEPSPTKAH